MNNRIQLFNPSDYFRKDNVVLPWKQLSELLQVCTGEFIIEDDAGNELPYQIDVIDPEDRSLDVLVIGLVKEIAPGSPDYIYSSGSLFIKKGVTSHVKSSSDPLRIEVASKTGGEDRGITLCNERMRVYFNLIPQLDAEQEQWYSGCATSILLDNVEILDIGNWLDHDREKRCIQIDQVIIPSTPWDSERQQIIDIYNKLYKIISINNNGLNRVSITVSTEPLMYVIVDPFTGHSEFKVVSLFRTISLDRYADYISETLFLRCSKIVPLRFRVRYFSYFNIGHDTESYYDPFVPDWLAIGNNKFAPFNGYGFATDVHNEEFASPHPLFPCAENASKSYSWSTGDGFEIHCIHRFLRGKFVKFDDHVGRCWYEKIYKPLKAQVSNKGEYSCWT